jgi:hypothetical protein
VKSHTHTHTKERSAESEGETAQKESFKHSNTKKCEEKKKHLKREGDENKGKQAKQQKVGEGEFTQERMKAKEGVGGGHSWRAKCFFFASHFFFLCFLTQPLTSNST